MNDDGVIYNSDFNNPTVFPATGFLTAERENDKGVYLAKHHDHIVATCPEGLEPRKNVTSPSSQTAVPDTQPVL